MLHVTVDQFPVAVELRRRPELRGRPVVVATPGATGDRGAILSASPEARSLGLEPGTALALARRPAVVILPLDGVSCRAAAGEVGALLRTVAGRWESEGWGDARLTPRVSDDVGALAATIQRRLFATTGLTCAVGIGDTALKARLAARLAAPCGVVELDDAGWRERIGPLPPDVLAGIGPRRRQRLHELAIDRVEDLAAAEEPVLAAAFGRTVGPRLRRIARGENGTPPRRRRAGRRTNQRPARAGL
jgi:DNA polymerase-4